MTPRIPHAIVKELCNMINISILINILAFNPIFRVMSHKVMADQEEGIPAPKPPPAPVQAPQAPQAPEGQQLVHLNWS